MHPKFAAIAVDAFVAYFCRTDSTWVFTPELCKRSRPVEGRHGPRSPKLTWKKLTEKDSCEWKLTPVDNQERSTWRSGVRSAMRAARQLPGRGPH